LELVGRVREGKVSKDESEAKQHTHEKLKKPIEPYLTLFTTAVLNGHPEF
jgi:hypothetical protein